MANDKLVNRENLKAFRQANDNRYAKPDGNYPTLTAGLADNLTPYSEDSGAEQTNPFISNGTGTNNNTEIVTVGDYALFKEKQGNTLVVNQLIPNKVLSGTNNGITIGSNGNGKYTITVNNATGFYQIDLISPAINWIRGHKYLVIGSITQNADIEVYISGYSNNVAPFYITSMASNQVTRAFLYVGQTTPNGTYNIEPKIIDLTQMFNGNIPQDLLDNPDHFSWYYNGDLSYNTGALENANGVKLVSTGRNLWDEVAELGYIDNNGNLQTSTSYIRTKNYISVIPSREYYIHMPINTAMYFTEYDKNNNFIKQTYRINEQTIITQPNTVKIKFYCSGVYGTTYNHDITISLYYTPEQGGEGYNKYYPYEQPYEVDTGNEVLRKADSVKDYKEPDGTIHRLVDEYTILGTETVFDYQFNGITDYIILVVPAIMGGVLVNVPNNIDKTISVTNSSNSNNHYLAITFVAGTYNGLSQAITAITGKKVNIPLATPTTEQGTPFAVNLPINDYGMLYWLDENDNLVGIPQGAKIFYPTNYKGFVDDVYMRTDGDASNLVVQSELSASETQRDTVDTQLKNAIGGTLRQCLCVKESLDFDNTDFVDLGSLSWTYNSTYQLFYITDSQLSSLKRKAKILDTLYKVVSTASIDITNMQITTDETGFFSNAKAVFIKNTSYTDTTTFKNAMKGVLLAYEKA